jgi:hypothetical protein
MLVLGKEKNVYGQVFGTTSSKKTLTVADCEKCIILTESVDPEVDIVDVVRGGELMWSWNTYQSNLPLSGIHLFSTGISDAKPVYDLKYIILTAGGGGKKGSGVAIIRISDKKIMFYAHVGGNTHSVELLPDGNIVTASSKGNYLTVLHVDTLHFPKDVYKKKIYIPDGHNVVWDKKRKVLWSAGKDHLYQFQYNFDCKKPNLTLKDSIRLPGNDAHDLFPVYGKDSLWFTSHPDGVYIIDMHTKKVSLVQTKFQENIKSVSSGPDNWPIIIMKPRVKWWSDKVIDLEGNVIFEKQGIKIYKARWFLSNHFSYYKHSQFEVCE